MVKHKLNWAEEELKLSYSYQNKDFRSKLQASWAQVLSRLGVKWSLKRRFNFGSIFEGVMNIYLDELNFFFDVEDYFLTRNSARDLSVNHNQKIVEHIYGGKDGVIYIVDVKTEYSRKSYFMVCRTCGKLFLEGWNTGEPKDTLHTCGGGDFVEHPSLILCEPNEISHEKKEDTNVLLLKNVDPSGDDPNNPSYWNQIVDKLSKPAKNLLWPNDFGLLNVFGRRFPNFFEVCVYLSKTHFQSQFKNDYSVYFPPMLLVGPSAIGKNEFCKELSLALFGKHSVVISLASGVTNFSINGSERSFKSSAPGSILATLLGREDGVPVRNPLVIFDELDKIKTLSKEFNPQFALLELLEKNQSEHFIDRFLGIPVNASSICYIALANTIEGLDPALLTRFKVFSIEQNTPEVLMNIVLVQAYESWSKEFRKGVLNTSIPQEWREQFCLEAKYNPRNFKGVFADNFCRLKERNIEDYYE